jgi:hypothetical protein
MDRLCGHRGVLLGCWHMEKCVFIKLVREG